MNTSVSPDRPGVGWVDPPKRRLRFPISLVFIAGFGGLVLLGITTVLGLGLVSASKNTFDLLQDKASLRLDVIEAQIRSVIDPAVALVPVLSPLLADDGFAPENQDRIVAILRGILLGVPHVTGLYFSDAESRTLSVGRWTGPDIELRIDRNHDFELIMAVARLREATEPFWQDVVWLEELGQPALNLNVPIRVDNKFVGALIVVVSLDSLARFVATLREPENGGDAFVLLGRDHVLAHAAMVDGQWQQNLTASGPPLPRRDQLSDPVLNRLEQAQVDYLFTTDRPPPHIAEVPERDPDYIVFGRLLEGYGDQPWVIGQHYRIETIGTEVRRLFKAGLMGLLVLVIAVVLALILGRRLTRRIRDLADATESVRTLDFANAPVLPDSRFRELAAASSAFNAMVAALSWFEMYVPKSLVLRLMRSDRHTIMTSQEREVTVMFTDIEGFSALSQRFTASQVADLLNAHFAMLADCVEADGGTIDKYIGDSVMAFWGAPEEQPDQAERAVRAAVAIITAITADNRRRRAAGEIAVRLRIGINTGLAVVGNIGSASRVNYTLVGDTVNVAQRLEDLGKAYHDVGDVVVLVSEPTAEAAAGGGARFTPLGEQQLRDLSGQIPVYQLTPVP